MEDPLPPRNLNSPTPEINIHSSSLDFYRFPNNLISYHVTKKRKTTSSLASIYSTREHALSTMESLQGQAVIETHEGKEDHDKLFCHKYEYSDFKQVNCSLWGYVHYPDHVEGRFCQFHRVREDQETYDNEKEQLKRFIEILLLSLQYLAFLLQKILQYLLIFCKFAEFPNRRRPKCTTMPWNIWPSLVVLWGVCWMFYTPSSHQEDTREQISFNDEYLTLFEPSKTLSYTIES
jgi:hypothetical protein